jgi:glycosyltransferase involved in cell wall biosynthesis
VSSIPGDGYGDAAVGMIAALEHLGIPVTWTPLTWGRSGLVRTASNLGPYRELAGRRIKYDTVILHLPPPAYWEFRPECRGRRVIALTTWETDRLPSDWSPILDGVDALIVPSTFNRDAFATSGVRTPVHVVPHAVRNRASGERPHLPVGDRFVFYTIAPWSTRKAIEETITAYLDAFAGREDVALVVKTSEYDLKALLRARRREPHAPTGKDVQPWWTLAHLLANRHAPPLVHLIAANVSLGEIDGIHERGDCFVSLTRAEGFGLNVFDAALARNPVIVTGWGGHLDYLGRDYPLLVDYDLARMDADPDDAWLAMVAEHHWAVADHDDAVDKLRWVDDHRDGAAAIGAQLAPKLSTEYSVAAVAKRLAVALR